jgi:hypothetical protein
VPPKVEKLLLLKKVKKPNNGIIAGLLKRRPAIAGLLFGLLMLLSLGCLQSGEFKVKLGQQFNLGINQTVIVSGANLRIKLLGISDSRNPRGGTFVRIGEANATLQINGSADNMTLVQPEIYPNDNSAVYGSYQIFFDVQPYPDVNHPVLDAGRWLEMSVQKVVVTVP